MREGQAETQSKIQFLVLSGGGAKGLAYTGMVDGLEETGALADIKAISGSSAGAISAALLATGMTAENFKKQAQTVDKSVLGGKVGWIERDGRTMYDNLKSNLKQNVIKALETSGEELRHWPQSVKDIYYKVAYGHAFTFSDLKTLHEFKPEIFKKLVVTAVDKATRELKIFSCDDAESQDVEVALACRASGSFMWMED